MCINLYLSFRLIMGSSILDTEISRLSPSSEQQDGRSRPTSYYENTTSGISNTSPLNTIRNESKAEKIPSQVDCLITTVPQNIAGQNIAGKHTPTRNSLRHSRMIVLNKTGNVSVKYLPAVVLHYKFIKSLLVLITFLGIVLCTLSVLLLMCTPNIRPRDNTYWSAIPVLASGIVGLFYLCFVPREHPTNRLTYWTKSLKILSTLTSLIAAAASFIICVFAVLHSVSLAMMTCAPPDKVNTSCVCTLNSTTESSVIRSYHYIDLSCSEVNILYIIVIITSIINAAVGVCEVLYLYLQWCRRTLYVYTKVPVNNNSDTVNTNNRQ